MLTAIMFTTVIKKVKRLFRHILCGIFLEIKGKKFNSEQYLFCVWCTSYEIQIRAAESENFRPTPTPNSGVEIGNLMSPTPDSGVEIGNLTTLTPDSGVEIKNV